MNKIGSLFFSLMFAGIALAQEPTLIEVTGDRVSLRAAPKPVAVLLGRAALHDQLVLMDNTKPDWVGVRPPDSLNFWVLKKYVDDNNQVLPIHLNVRSGPSLSHEVLGLVQRGETLRIRGSLEGWLKIAPPVGTIVWISRQYTDCIIENPIVIQMDPQPADVSNPDAKPVIHITVTPARPNAADIVDQNATEKEISDVVKTVMQPVINDILVAATALPNLPETLKPAGGKEQGGAAHFSGILQPANAILSKLVDPENPNTVICYVRGNRAQMKTYAGRSLSMSGKSYWADEMKIPFLVPEKIEVLSVAAAE